MRIKLKKGVQKNLIKKLKKQMTWPELSEKLSLSKDYIRNELKNEERTLSLITYRKICSLLGKNFNQFIEKRLKDNWGRSLGGKHSLGNTKKFDEIKKNKNLAELFGIILGDGHLEVYKKNEKRSYALKIAGEMEKDYEYLLNRVSKLLKFVFKEAGKIREMPEKNEVFLVIYGKNLIKILNRHGLKSGNKKLNNQGIPNWIKEKNSFLLSCIRGLIDTDGSIHYISKKNRNLRISFTSYIPRLLNDAHKAFIKLGFNPSKLISEKQFFISSKKQVNKYIKKIGFKNPKHLKRLKDLKKQAPVV